MSKLMNALPLVAALVLAGCAEAPPDSGSELPVVSSSNLTPVTADLGLAQPAVPTITVSPAIAQRSAALATNGTFDQSFYDASAARNAKNIAKLTQGFLDLGPEVDPEEAQRAATVVYTYVDQLVAEYEIDSGPMHHNTQVNWGVKPRGLCWHWAHDLDARLQKENFQTLEIHRAIANYNNIRLEHSATILGRRGDSMADSLVLDPWRKGGDLVWLKVSEDTRYNWTQRDEVFAYKREREARKTQ